MNKADIKKAMEEGTALAYDASPSTKYRSTYASVAYVEAVDVERVVYKGWSSHGTKKADGIQIRYKVSFSGEERHEVVTSRQLVSTWAEFKANVEAAQVARAEKQQRAQTSEEEHKALAAHLRGLLGELKGFEPVRPNFVSRVRDGRDSYYDGLLVSREAANRIIALLEAQD